MRSMKFFIFLFLKKSITHIIVSLGSGGAEKTLYNFAANDNQNVHKIITLMKDNFYKIKYKKKYSDK